LPYYYCLRRFNYTDPGWKKINWRAFIPLIGILPHVRSGSGLDGRIKAGSCFGPNLFRDTNQKAAACNLIFIFMRTCNKLIKNDK
jgi:hypothetical protein